MRKDLRTLSLILTSFQTAYIKFCCKKNNQGKNGRRKFYFKSFSIINVLNYLRNIGFQHTCSMFCGYALFVLYFPIFVHKNVLSYIYFCKSAREKIVCLFVFNGTLLCYIRHCTGPINTKGPGTSIFSFAGGRTEQGSHKSPDLYLLT